MSDFYNNKKEQNNSTKAYAALNSYIQNRECV